MVVVVVIVVVEVVVLVEVEEEGNITVAWFRLRQVYGRRAGPFLPDDCFGDYFVLKFTLVMDVGRGSTSPAVN